MAPESDESPTVSSAMAAMRERQDLGRELLRLTAPLLDRRNRLIDRMNRAQEHWESTRPHSEERTSEFVRLKYRVVDQLNLITKAMNVSTATMREVPRSRGALRFLLTHPTPKKSLEYEQEYIRAAQGVINERVPELSALNDRLEESVAEIESFVQGAEGI